MPGAALGHPHHRTAALPQATLLHPGRLSRRPADSPGNPPARLAHHRPSPGPTGAALSGPWVSWLRGAARQLSPQEPEAPARPPGRAPLHTPACGLGWARLRPGSTPGPPPCPLTQRLQRPRHRRAGGHSAAHPPGPEFRHTTLAALIGSGRYQNEAEPAASPLLAAGQGACAVVLCPPPPLSRLGAGWVRAPPERGICPSRTKSLLKQTRLKAGAAF